MRDIELRVIAQHDRGTFMALLLQTHDGDFGESKIKIGVSHQEAREDFPIGRRFKLVPVDETRE